MRRTSTAIVHPLHDSRIEELAQEIAAATGCTRREARHQAQRQIATLEAYGEAWNQWAAQEGNEEA